MVPNIPELRTTYYDADTHKETGTVRPCQYYNMNCKLDLEIRS